MDRDEELRRRRGEHTRSYSQDRPIGSGENASALIRGIKQWLPDIPGSVGDLVDMAYAGGRNVLQGQKQRSTPSLGLGEKARKLVKQRPALEQVQMTETPETNWLEEGTRMLNPAMWNPRAAMKLGALGLAAGVPGASLAIVKPRGGNWFTGSGSELEAGIRSLMKGSQDNYRTLLAKGMIDEAAVQAKPEYALNKWLEGPLTRYLKRDLATEGDPVRKLLEGDRPVSHMRLDELMDNADQDWISREALWSREAAGLPRAGVGRGGYGQAWETIADAMTKSQPIEEIRTVYPPTHPMSAEWTKKLPGDTPIYDFAGDKATDYLGLPHLRDELWNAMRQDSDLPQALRLRPEDFQQMGIEKAIRHVANINDWRAAQKAQANLEMLTGPGVKLVREYPENNPKGLRWVELKASEWKPPEGYEYDARTGTWQDPYSESMQPIRSPGVDRESLSRQLKYEGDVMGHCVGGYCDDVLNGTARIFSLRDAKGEPHVTVEVAPTDIGDIIQQIKGKQNLPPKDEYLPFVQDFIRNPYHGGQWYDEIGDFESTGLLGTSKGFYTKDEAYKMLADPAYKELGPELLDALDSVHTPGANPEYDAILEAYRAQNPGYAQGGLVGRQDFGGVVGYILD